MSTESLELIGREITERIDARDPDWVVVDDEDKLTLYVQALPGQQLKIREDQIKNKSGGYVYAVSDQTRVRRFLILGTSGGSYYSTEKEMTLDNVEALKDIIHRGKAQMILDEIREISLAGRNPKQEPVMLALALCARYKVSEVGAKQSSAISKLYVDYLKAMHREALKLANEVCRIPTHLFAFVGFCELVAREKGEEKKKKKGEEKAAEAPIPAKSTGWGRLMRKFVERWYASRTPDELAMHITKYGQREGWSHRDLFRLAHPVPPSTNDDKLVYEQVFHYAVKGELNPRKRRLPEDSEEARAAKERYTEAQIKAEDESKALTLLERVKTLNKDVPVDEVVKAIREQGLVREHIPTELLDSRVIWAALLEKMPMTAMIRNLGKMSAIGLLEDPEQEKKVIAQLADVQRLKKARVHPIQILLAKTVYSSGRGVKGALTWKVQHPIEVALEAAFYSAFVNVPATGKRFCLAFDISGSMRACISGTHLSARDASAAIGLTLLKNETDVECVGFCDDLAELPFTGEWTLGRVDEYMNTLRMGMTDCALPMVWAKEKQKQFDVFIVFTDNETYYGNIHPSEALLKYREWSGIEARLVVCGMTATNFTIADPTDAGMLDVVGFDSAVPELIANFVTGQI